eukprot:scaffold10571_cov154-Cylindrotheca_fusiformis.AAC.15
MNACGGILADEENLLYLWSNAVLHKSTCDDRDQDDSFESTLCPCWGPVWKPFLFSSVRVILNPNQQPVRDFGNRPCETPVTCCSQYPPMFWGTAQRVKTPSECKGWWPGRRAPAGQLPLHCRQMDLGTGPSPEPISHHNKPAENRKAGRNGTTEQRAAPVGYLR